MYGTHDQLTASIWPQPGAADNHGFNPVPDSETHGGAAASPFRAATPPRSHIRCPPLQVTGPSNAGHALEDALLPFFEQAAAFAAAQPSVTGFHSYHYVLLQCSCGIRRRSTQRGSPSVDNPSRDASMGLWHSPQINSTSAWYVVATQYLPPMKLRCAPHGNGLFPGSRDATCRRFAAFARPR
jgi:hypothetical protein